MSVLALGTESLPVGEPWKQLFKMPMTQSQAQNSFYALQSQGKDQEYSVWWNKQTHIWTMDIHIHDCVDTPWRGCGMWRAEYIGSGHIWVSEAHWSSVAGRPQQAKAKTGFFVAAFYR